MRKTSGEFDGVFLPLAAVYLLSGVAALLVGYGVKPLLVASAAVLVLRGFFSDLESAGGQGAAG